VDKNNDPAQCENCDRTIGRLEHVYEWDGHRVCRECRVRLERQTRLPAGPDDAADRREVRLNLHRPAPEPPDPDRPRPATTLRANDAPPLHPEEDVVWQGVPSQIVNVKVFALTVVVCIVVWAAAFLTNTAWTGNDTFRNVSVNVLFALSGLISLVLVLRAIWKWLTIENIRYELTTERFRTTTGVLSRMTEELELYRVKDTVLLQPIHLRVFGLGHVMMLTSDKSSPTVVIRAIRNVREVREKVRRLVERRRDHKRVREVDFE
jgi:membrane protein YdbS with pleckstrin-like domain